MFIYKRGRSECVYIQKGRTGASCWAVCKEKAPAEDFSISVSLPISIRLCMTRDGTGSFAPTS